MNVKLNKKDWGIIAGCAFLTIFFGACLYPVGRLLSAIDDNKFYENMSYRNIIEMHKFNAELTEKLTQEMKHNLAALEWPQQHEPSLMMSAMNLLPIDEKRSTHDILIITGNKKDQISNLYWYLPPGRRARTVDEAELIVYSPNNKHEGLQYYIAPKDNSAFRFN